VPANPLAEGRLRHDGANAVLRWLVEKPGGIAPLYLGGPRSADPWFGMKFTGQMDPDAEVAFAERGPEVREIMEEVGMGDLLSVLDDRENPDYDDEWVHIMSHPDTHAAYLRAYRIWMQKNKPEPGETEEGSIDQGRRKPRLVGQTTPQSPRKRPEITYPDCDEPEQEMYATVNRFPDKTTISLEGPDLKARLASTRQEAGVHLDPETETEDDFSQQCAVYIYRDTDPIKARVEWPSYLCDDTYLAGVWRANLATQM